MDYISDNFDPGFWLGLAYGRHWQEMEGDREKGGYIDPVSFPLTPQAWGNKHDGHCY